MWQQLQFDTNLKFSSFTVGLLRTFALILTLVLFLVGSIPSIGHTFQGEMHWIAHGVTYSMIGFTFPLAWPQWTAQVILLVIALGSVHEAVEIVSHNHTFEVYDALANGVASIVGVAIARIIIR